MPNPPGPSQFEFTSTMTVTQPEQDLLAVSKTGWIWLREGIEQQTDPTPWAYGAAWACFGIAIAFGLGWWTWEPVYNALPDAAKIEFSGRGPLMLIGTVAFFLLAAVFLVTGWQVGKALKRNRGHLLTYMDSIYQKSPEGQSSSSEAIS